jgi:UPF0271 protein
MRTIDLNADLGEGYGPWGMGDDAAMLALVSSANVACGGHASDPETMARTLKLAKAHGVVTGAHPSYPDKEGFGRRRMVCTPAEITHFVAAQVGALVAIGALVGQEIAYVKPHGMLANVAAEEAEVAEAIVNAVAAVLPGRGILAISGTVLAQVAAARGVPVYREVFADRGYTAAGTLVPRSQPGAMLHGEAAVRRLLGFLESGAMPVVGGGTVALAVDSVCIHGDSPESVALARAVKAGFAATGVAVAAFAA